MFIPSKFHFEFTCLVVFLFSFVALSKTTENEVDLIWIYKCNGTIGYTHMSTIETIYLSNSNPLLVSAWQASSGTEGSSDQHIMFSRSFDLGITWSVPKTIAFGQRYQRAVWGPVLFHDAINKKLWLFYSESGPFNARTTDRNYPGGNILYKTSNDYGVTWSNYTQILSYYQHSNISKVTANKLIAFELEKNTGKYRWILPFWQEKHGNDTGIPCSSVLISDDNGQTWNVFGEIKNNQTWLIENTIAPIYDSDNHNNMTSILQFFRTTEGYIYQSYSYDFGLNWTIAVPNYQLLNPNSKTFVFTDSFYQQILAYNPSKTNRNPIDLAISKDNSATWQNAIVLQNDTSKSLAYPTTSEVQISTNDGTEYMAYTTYSADTNDGILLAITPLPQ